MIKTRHTLYVLYKLKARHILTDALILSFMSPKEEQALYFLNPNFISGRREMNAVREEARKVYIDLIARIAATPCVGKTLRQSLHLENRGNPWWYHKLSEKKPENDQTFNFLLQVFTILHVAEREFIENIVIYGSPIEVALVLRNRYKIKIIKCISTQRTYFFRGLLSRLKYLVKILYFHTAIKYNIISPNTKPEVVFQSFWDWSIQIDRESRRIKDNYFKMLPEHLMAKGIQFAWFLWFDPYFKFGSEGRSLRKVLKPAFGHPQLIFTQKFLGFTEILSAIFDFRHLYRYLRYSHTKDFRSLFKQDGCDLWPLLNRALMYGFCDASLPHYFLMELAYRRAFSFFRPKLSLSFLELHLPARAFYQGASFGHPAVVKCTMQHASYNREKTNIFIDTERDLFGRPDSIPMPVPDYFFVMGELCKDILIENGFPTERIFLTGSARYDHITVTDARLDEDSDFKAIKVLLLPSLESDFEMVEAILLASKGLNLKLYLRRHPFKNITLFKHYDKIIVSRTDSLEDELKDIDLLLFTHSTVAEEAFLKGIPVLQWQTFSFNGSVFRDLQVIPSVYSVEGLKKTLESFIDNPSLFKPTEQIQRLVLRKCFYTGDGRASNRITDLIQWLID